MLVYNALRQRFVDQPLAHPASHDRIHNPAIKNWAGRKVAYAVCILMQLRILKLNRKLVANDQPVVHGPPAYILTVTISTSFWKLAAKY